MDAVEQSLLLALEANPSDWDVRFLIAEKKIARDAPGEAATLIALAPEPPETDAELERAVVIAGKDAIPLVEQYIAADVTAAYGHILLAHLLEEKGETERAKQHEEVARALGGQIPSHQTTEDGDQVFTSIPLPPAEIETASLDVIEESRVLVKPSKQYSTRALSIFAAVAFHFVLAIIATLMIVLPPSREEPEIVAAIVAPIPKKQEQLEKVVTKQVKMSASAASAAAPIALLMKANAVAKISLPQVAKTSTGPLGLGEASFGAGEFGSGLVGGVGKGETMFGSMGGGGLQGKFYDLKQSRDKKPSGINATNSGVYYGILKSFSADEFNPKTVEKFFVAEQGMAFTNLLIPDMSANIGPKAFNVEKEVQPKGWFVHYTGRMVPPEAGDWRWVGRFDDAVMVYVDNRLVFDGSWTTDSKAGVSNAFGNTKCANGQPALAGKWTKLSGAFNIDIFVGERPGGTIGGALLVERKGEKYKKRADGTPIIPLFSVVPLSDAVKKRVADFKFGIAKETPIFKAIR